MMVQEARRAAARITAARGIILRFMERLLYGGAPAENRCVTPPYLKDTVLQLSISIFSEFNRKLAEKAEKENGNFTLRIFYENPTQAEPSSAPTRLCVFEERF